MAEEPEHWRQFQGSELGSLLAGLYGGTRPKINYPKPKQRKQGPRGNWLPVNNDIKATDPRKATVRRDKKVNVPRVAIKQHGEVSLIDCIPRRKNESTISDDMDQMKLQASHYRPAHFQVRGEAEKERLSQINGYKGGKSLPNEMTSVPSDAPFEIAERKARLEAMATKRAGMPQFRGAMDDARRGGPVARPVKLSHNENMANQISSEIDERMDYLSSMKSTGTLNKGEQDKLQGEITMRLRELKAFDEEN